MTDKKLQDLYEERLDEKERHTKNWKYALYEKDYEILEKSNLENRIIFEAVD